MPCKPSNRSSFSWVECLLRQRLTHRVGKLHVYVAREWRATSSQDMCWWGCTAAKHLRPDSHPQLGWRAVAATELAALRQARSGMEHVRLLPPGAPSSCGAAGTSGPGHRCWQAHAAHPVADRLPPDPAAPPAHALPQSGGNAGARPPWRPGGGWCPVPSPSPQPRSSLADRGLHDARMAPARMLHGAEPGEPRRSCAAACQGDAGGNFGTLHLRASSPLRPAGACAQPTAAPSSAERHATGAPESAGTRAPLLPSVALLHARRAW